MLKECSILIGGKAGDGIRQAGSSIASLLNELGYWVFVYEDYPSIIRGGHNFSIIRGAKEKILAHEDAIDILIALDQQTIDKHSQRLKNNSLIIFDSNAVKAEGAGFALTEIVKKNNLPPIVRNTAVLGALAAILGADFSLAEKVIRNSLNKKVEENIVVARETYELAKNSGKKIDLIGLPNQPKELMTGNEALALGAVKGGLEFYAAYPMTPVTAILHYLAENRKKFGIQAIHAENEIGVIGMAEGAAYAGKRAMVSTSGGGFALMIEHLSLAGQAEIPIVIILGQRPGPATGLPTYTGQGELLFVLHSGHGEFPRIIIAPGDTEEAIEAARDAQNLAWQFQIPVIILGDKHLCESTFSTEPDKIASQKIEPKLWDKKGVYRRYRQTDDGISPLAFPGQAGAVVKSDSYEHDEDGITTEEAGWTVKNAEKRIKKAAAIVAELKKRPTVKVYGDEKSDVVLLVWGSTKGGAVEAAARTGCRVVQPLFLHPLPVWELAEKLKGARRIIGIEANATGQFCGLAEAAGIKIDAKILKYDGRPFTVAELAEKIKNVL
jgi:2-oxoglutarate/2-oxoacid ferredoxin oxidoreductase subunit alpha